MSEGFDKQKMMETLVDPEISSILVELESGEKSLTYLAEKLHLSSTHIKKRLSYLIEYNFIIIENNRGNEIAKIDLNKLDKIMESDDNFQNVVDGLTELDQFLN